MPNLISLLINPKEYTGNDSVGGVGNGSDLPIQHVGSAKLSSMMFYIVLVHASTNIFFIHRFSLNNTCYLIFFPDHFYVKNIKTQRMLFEGKCENGLYPLQCLTFNKVLESCFAFVGKRVHAQIWHSRLGHPTSPVLSFMFLRQES